MRGVLCYCCADPAESLESLKKSEKELGRFRQLGMESEDTTRLATLGMESEDTTRLATLDGVGDRQWLEEKQGAGDRPASDHAGVEAVDENKSSSSTSPKVSDEASADDDPFDDSENQDFSDPIFSCDGLITSICDASGMPLVTKYALQEPRVFLALGCHPKTSGGWGSAIYDMLKYPDFGIECTSIFNNQKFRPGCTPGGTPVGSRKGSVVGVGGEEVVKEADGILTKAVEDRSVGDHGGDAIGEYTAGGTPGMTETTNGGTSVGDHGPAGDAIGEYTAGGISGMFFPPTPILVPSPPSPTLSLSISPISSIPPTLSLTLSLTYLPSHTVFCKLV